ncbi:MAG TPA: 6-phosphogluconolactonase [Gemmatimonadales bacterium]|nr:6-phosphogluconolactonase [Gemmatimonadales bacterium]
MSNEGVVRAGVEVLADVEALADAAAERVTQHLTAAIQARGQAVVVLAGGSTPRPTYERLAGEGFSSRIPWPCVHVVWGDERCVPPDDAESNYRMARTAWLDRVPIPPANVHRIHGEDDPAVAASAYEAMLRDLVRAAGPPDLVVLGLGEDGHTASLFPGSGAVRERTRWVMPEYSRATGTWRVTLTPVVINTTAEVLFLVSGAHKAEILKRVLEGPRRPDDLPAQAIAPSGGRVDWLVDRAAAAGLERP